LFDTGIAFGKRGCCVGEAEKDAVGISLDGNE